MNNLGDIQFEFILNVLIDKDVLESINFLFLISTKSSNLFKKSAPIIG